jgi:hypothetical protein
MVERRDRVTCDGRRVQVSRYFNVTQPCSFTALELRFPVTNAPPDQLKVYTPVEGGQFGTETEGEEMSDVTVMELVAAPPPCPADANGDNAVNGADLSVLLSQFGQNVPPGTGADSNGDGIVNGADLSVLLSSFGAAC